MADLSNLTAALFDLDGVLTPTAAVHQDAWRELFSAEFERRGVAPYLPEDYFTYLDGRKRYDGVAAILHSRGIVLSFGDPSDGPTAETVCGLGNKKNAVFAAILKRDGVAPYPGSLAFLQALDAAGVAKAVVSSSKNARPVLEAAGLLERFPVIVDGAVAEAEGIPGKPAPDMYLRAAEALGRVPAECMVIEDAISGVASGAAGHVGGVIGVDRGVGRDELFKAGATQVVDDLGELVDQLRA